MVQFSDLIFWTSLYGPEETSYLWTANVYPPGARLKGYTFRKRSTERLTSTEYHLLEKTDNSIKQEHHSIVEDRQ